MGYSLKQATIRTNNSKEGMERIAALWADVESGKLPLLFDSDHTFLSGVSPVSRYSNYASDETGDYDLSILGVTADFFGQLESFVASGAYKKYDESGEDLHGCTTKAWEKAWADQENGVIRRAFTEDYESSVPAQFTKDGKAHCYLYLAVK